MITKAIIKQTNQLGSNIFRVYIPLLRNANDTEEDATRDATYCFTNGIFNTLKVGDVVFVDFEDNLYNKPVIMGKLFLGNEQDGESEIQISAKTLLTDGTTNLKGGATIGGIDVVSKLSSLSVSTETNVGKITDLENDVNNS